MSCNKGQQTEHLAGGRNLFNLFRDRFRKLPVYLQFKDITQKLHIYMLLHQTVSASMRGHSPSCSAANRWPLHRRFLFCCTWASSNQPTVPRMIYCTCVNVHMRSCRPPVCDLHTDFEGSDLINCTAPPPTTHTHTHLQTQISNCCRRIFTSHNRFTVLAAHIRCVSVCLECLNMYMVLIVPS